MKANYYSKCSWEDLIVYIVCGTFAGSFIKDAEMLSLGLF